MIYRVLYQEESCPFLVLSRNVSTRVATFKTTQKPIVASVFFNFINNRRKTLQMNHELKAVVFDMDGLMFNTEDLYDQVGQTILQRRGQNYSLELKLEMMGLPGNEAFEIMRKRCNIDDSVEQLKKETDEIFEDLLHNIEKMPGLDELLSLIEEKAIPKAVATSSHRQFATRALGFFNLEPRFEFVLTGDDVENGKPNPDVYLLAAKKLRVSTENMLVLEDSLIGSRAAKAAGTFTVAVPTTHSRQSDFSHVDHVVDRLDHEIVMSLIRK